MSDMGDSDEDAARMQSFKEPNAASTTQITRFLVLAEGGLVNMTGTAQIDPAWQACTRCRCSPHKRMPKANTTLFTE